MIFHYLFLWCYMYLDFVSLLVLWCLQFLLLSAQAVHKQVQNKAIRIINNVPLCDHTTPYYVNLDLIELPSIVKLHTCQPLYDHLINEKPSNYTVSLVSEQHNYATWNASLQHLNPCFSGINIRKFCPTVIGCYYWNDLPLSVYRTWQKKHPTSIILFSIN